MRIATWNVNSIRARRERLLAWLERHEPDVLCLQELKVTDDKFPYDEVREHGYHAAVFGQKTYNGVAILSRTEPEEVVRGMDDGADDPQARFIVARIGEVTVASAYVPNGDRPGTDKFEYKLQWLKRLRTWLDQHHGASEPLALCGDLNVAPDDKDVAFPEQWAGTVLCHDQARSALEHVREFGLHDVFRKHHPDGGVYSWWDYQMLAFPKGNGLRIDHVFATEPLAKRSRDASVDRDERKGKKPSDHAPVIVEFDPSG